MKSVVAALSLSLPLSLLAVSSASAAQIVKKPEGFTLYGSDGSKKTYLWPDSLKYVESYVVGKGETFIFSSTPEKRDCKPSYVGKMADSLELMLEAEVRSDGELGNEISIPGSRLSSEGGIASDTLMSVGCDPSEPKNHPVDYMIIESERQKANRLD